MKKYQAVGICVLEYVKDKWVLVEVCLSEQSANELTERLNREDSKLRETQAHLTSEELTERNISS